MTAIGAFLAALLLLSGCGLVLEQEKLIRLGPGECVVLARSSEVVVIGQGCKAERTYR